jgi:hypothetical protein
MSEPDAPSEAPAEDGEKKPSAAEKDAPIWASGLAIVVIVTLACTWLLSDRDQEPSAEKSPAAKERAAPAEEADPRDQMPEAEEPPVPTRPSASAREPVPEKEEPAPPPE